MKSASRSRMPAKCPQCGTTRDAIFVKDEESGQLAVIFCEACEWVTSCCPDCGTFKTRRTEDQENLICTLCKISFPRPRHKIDQIEISKQKLDFLIRVGNEFSKCVGPLRSFDEFEEATGKEITERDYVREELSWFVVIPRLVCRDRDYSDTEMLASEILTENHKSQAFSPPRKIGFYRTAAIRTKRAEDLSDILLNTRNEYALSRIRREYSYTDNDLKEICFAVSWFESKERSNERLASLMTHKGHVRCNHDKYKTPLQWFRENPKAFKSHLYALRDQNDKGKVTRLDHVILTRPIPIGSGLKSTPTGPSRGFQT